MRFDIEDGKLAAEKWRWVTFREHEEEIGLHVYIPDSAEWNRFLTRFRLGGNRADWDAALLFIARTWFDDFKGATDKAGKDLENNEVHRKLILRKKTLWDWLFGVLAEAQDGLEEGN